MKFYSIRVSVESVNGGYLSMCTDVKAFDREEAIEKGYKDLRLLALQKLGTIDGKYNVDFCRLAR